MNSEKPRDSGRIGESLELRDLIKTLQRRTIRRHLIRNLLMKRSIHCVLHRRRKPLSRNTNKLTGKLSKTKGNVKAGTPSNHLEKAGSRGF